MKKSLLPLLLTVFLDSLGFGLVFPLLSPLIMQADSPMLHGASLTMRGMFFGIIISSFCLGQFFGGPILGAISDRLGRKKVICWTLLIGVIGYLLASVSVLMGSVIVLLLARILTGVSSSNFILAQSMVADLSDEEEKRKNFGLIGMAWGVGFILGPFLGGRFIDIGGATAPFLFAAFFCMINLILARFMLQETLMAPRATPLSFFGGVRDLKRAFQHPTLRGIFTVTFLFSFGWGFFTEFSAIFLMDRFHFGPVEIGNFYAYIGIWIALCQGLLIRPFVSRFSSQQLIRGALFFVGLNLLIFLASSSPLILFLAVPLISLPEALLYPNIVSMVSSLSAKDEQGEMLGIHNSVQWASIGILPLFSGSLVANYPIMPILFASFMMFVALGAFAFFFRRKVVTSTLS